MACKQILESKSLHDYQQCSCENQAFVDGGTDYCRYGGRDMKKIELIDGYA